MTGIVFAGDVQTTSSEPMGGSPSWSVNRPILSDPNLYLVMIDDDSRLQNVIYLVGDKKKKECALVDPGWLVDVALKTAEEDGMKVVAGLLTHTHRDHSDGVEELIKKTGCKIYVHENEAEALKKFAKNVVKTHEGMKIQIGDVALTVLYTPGHTEGGQCFLGEGFLFSGDTLFPGNCGNTKKPRGNASKMAVSIWRLSELDEKTIIYAGHHLNRGSTSTMGYEKQTNPCMAQILSLFRAIKDKIKPKGNEPS